MNRRVVVTGMGIWSCIGQDLETVAESLKRGRSGIIFDPKRVEFGLQSGLVGNVPRPDLKPLLPRKFRATMSEDAEYAYMAARQAFEQAEISDEYLRQNEVGIIWGSDYITNGKVENAKIMREEKNSLMLGPGALFKSESSTASMNLSGIFHITGINICVGAACASSLQAIGMATTFIRQGLQKVILVGGANELSPHGPKLLEEIEGCSLNNLHPTEASRPFDLFRDGMVNSGGGAALILEEYEHAMKRGVKPLFEITGYGFSVAEYFLRQNINAFIDAMSNALKDAGISANDVNYISSSASGGINGDVLESKALAELFVNKKSLVSSTESMTGHEHNMAGASKTIYSGIMMLNDFVAPNINITELIQEAKSLNIALRTVNTPVNNVLVNGTGLGGITCSIVISKIK